MWLFTFTFIGLINYLYGANMCQSSCNDGGCAYTDQNGIYSCDCSISKKIQTGKECEIYVNACEKISPCENNGKCVTLMGDWYCDCPNNYYGVSCKYYNKTTKAYPKKPSFYYRRKIKSGESIITYFVIENNVQFKYKCQFGDELDYKLLTPLESATTDELHATCLQMSSADFPVNAKMCDSVKTTYGNSKIMFLANQYWMHKKKEGREDVYFGGVRSLGRMGGLYSIKIEIFDGDENFKTRNAKPLLIYDYHHLVVDDHSSYCIPFIDRGHNCELDVPLKVKRNDAKVIKMKINPDIEVCKANDSIKYTYQWLIFDGLLVVQLITESELPNVSKKPKDIDKKQMIKQDLVLPQYSLPEGFYTVVLMLTVKDEKNGSAQYNPNINGCRVKVIIVGLHAEIVGSPERSVSNSNLITLNASLSFNPNEPSHRQNQDVYYVWRCDVEADVDNCKEYTTTSPIRTLPRFLDKAKKYEFNLITRVSDAYAERVGKPTNGAAKIILFPNAIASGIKIKCVKNCRHLSNPLEIVYLMVEMNNYKNNCSLEWYYKEQSHVRFISANNVRDLDTPLHVFISIKRSLDYNKVYTFKVKDSVSKQENSIVIRTAAEPTVGKCLVNPTVGTAWTTVFNITCPQLRDDDLSYYYYERYKNVNDRDELSLLMDWGSNKLNNIILPTSGIISVLAVNSFGCYVYVNISVKIIPSNRGELVNMFKEMKTHLINGHTAATVRILSIICDVFLKFGIDDGFSVLFNTLSKITSKGHITCIEQTVLALTKVVHTCSIVNDHKIKSADALAISTNLLLLANNLFGYLKTIQIDDIVRESEQIERIYSYMKIIVDILIKDIDPVIYNHDRTIVTRYFWSSLDDMAIATQNIEQTLTVFGESILLHQFLFEKPRIYESKESYFWSNILDADKLKKQNNIINSTLAEELLADKRQAWGLQIFEINKKVALWIQNITYTNEVNSNIKYVALSSYDKPINGKYLGLIHEIVSPVLITFNIVETMHKFNNYKAYTIVLPSANSEQIEIDKAIQVFRFDMTEVGSVFVTIRDSSHSLLITWTRDCRPDSVMMADEQYTMKISAGDNRQMTFQTNKDHQNDIHYIGIFADMAAHHHSTPKNLNDITFYMNMVCMQCLYWKHGAWSSKGMEVAQNSSVDGNVQCHAYHLSMFKSSIFVIPDLINPLDEIHLFSTIANNMVCLILVTVIFILYLVLLYWSSINDRKDVFMSRIIILDDNHMGEDEVYLVTVYTGHGFGSGTSANVCIELNGAVCNSRTHWLHSLDNYQTMQRSNDDWFVIFTPKSLGELQSIHIWHDNYGTDPDWYCQQIIVTEVRSNKAWVFEVEKWFTIRESTKKIEHTIYISNSKINWRKETRKNFEMGIRENHLWASVFIRKGRLLQLNKITQNARPRVKQTSVNGHQSTSKKAVSFIIERLVENKLYYPVHTEMITEVRQWNYWFIIGWCCCVMVYVLTAFCIILYGLKFGRVKSICWLTSITIGILQGVVVTSPFKIIMISAVIAKYNSKTVDQMVTFMYNLTLHRYRKKTRMFLQDVEYVRAIRNYRRRRYIYEPLTRKTVEILRDQRNLTAHRKNTITDVIICMVLIITCLSCLHNLKVFSKNNTYRANQMVSAYLEHESASINRRITLDNLKTFLSSKLLKKLHSSELYNGVPITKDMMNMTKYDKRGWFGLYNSRLIGGGVRFRQKRVNSNGENDQGNYGVGWTDYDGARVKATSNTPWTYSKATELVNFPFYDNWMATNNEVGYELYVTDGLINEKLTIDEYLKQKWLDDKVRRFNARFQIYSPDVDLVTVVEIRAITVCGLTYLIFTDVVRTVPASSVITGWDTYLFTATVSGFLLVAGSVCMLVRTFRWSNHRRCIQWSVAYDGLLLVLVVTTIYAFLRRLSIMEKATAELSAATDDVYVDLWPSCHMQVVCTFFSTTLMAAALLKLTRILWLWPRQREE